MDDSAAVPPPATPRVLLLDDDRFMLEVLKDMLAACGVAEVFAETDAVAALATLAECAPDLLICDLALPGMDGVEFLQAAASRGFGGKVVLLSGMDCGVREAAGELARVLGLKVAAALKKPVGLEQLRAIVAS